MTQKILARISRADLGFEDHGIFAVSLEFDYGGAMQGTGSYALSNASGGPFLEALLNAVGVSQWKDLEGKTVFVLKQSEHGQHLIEGIEKLPTEKRGGRIVFKEFFEIQEALAKL